MEIHLMEPVVEVLKVIAFLLAIGAAIAILAGLIIRLIKSQDQEVLSKRADDAQKAADDHKKTM